MLVNTGFILAGRICILINIVYLRVMTKFIILYEHNYHRTSEKNACIHAR